MHMTSTLMPQKVVPATSLKASVRWRDCLSAVDVCTEFAANPGLLFGQCTKSWNSLKDRRIYHVLGRIAPPNMEQFPGSICALHMLDSIALQLLRHNILPQNRDRGLKGYINTCELRVHYTVSSISAQAASLAEYQLSAFEYSFYFL